MKKILLTAIAAQKSNRPPDYESDLLAAGRIEGDYLILSHRAALLLLAKYDPPRAARESQRVSGCGKPRALAASTIHSPLSTPQPLPRAKWPGHIRQMAELQLPADRGVGDTVARIIGPFGSDAFKLWYAEVRGVWSKTCRCGEWHALWNARYPYPQFDSPALPMPPPSHRSAPSPEENPARAARQPPDASD